MKEWSPEVIKELNNQSEQLGHLDFKLTKNIFIDMSCIQDFRLGALLNLINSEEEYQYILANLDIYNKALDKKIMKYFPRLEYIEEEIDVYLNDTSHRLPLSLYSPMTSLYEEMFNLIETIDRKNKEKDTKANLTIYLNSCYFEYEKKERIIADIHGINRAINVIFLHTNSSLLDESLLRNLDILILYSIGSFLREAITARLVMSEGILQDRCIIAIAEADNKHHHKSDTELEQLLETTSIAFNLLCNFKWVTKKIMIA